MFKEEAEWISNTLQELPIYGASIANVGSSTNYFRRYVQPHIHDLIIAPLETNYYVHWTHIDLKDDEGIDIIADICSPNFALNINKTFDIVICSNMLEHVNDVYMVIDNVWRILKPGGYLLVTVPHRYPLHFDPIDNGYRPTPEQLARLFENRFNLTVVKKQCIVIKDKDYYPIKKSRIPLWSYRKRLKYWLGRYYQTSGVLLLKNE